jgi:class 3 adenylate cyclase/DNA-binding response OmpR family regulator
MTHEPTILIVDDDDGARNTLNALLCAEGYELVAATSGHEALTHLEDLAPDVILLDVMMPGMDGFEVCGRVKADERWRHIPIVLVTALDSRQDLVRGLDAGADDFVSKPVNGPELRARVRSMLRIKQQVDLLEKQRRELETTLSLKEELAQVTARRLEELELLHGVGLRLMSAVDAGRAAEVVSLTALQSIPQATHCVMHFLSKDRQQMAPVVFSSHGKDQPGGHLGTERILREAIENRRIIYVPDVFEDPRRTDPLSFDIHAFLVVPMIVDDQPIGALSVASPQLDAFEIAHRRILSILASQAAVAIVKARLFEQLERTSEREKWFVRGLFQRYVNPTVVDRLVEEREDLTLGGKRAEITVLFADICGFTAFSENLPPEHLIEVLNRYLALAVDPILALEGTLDKFTGDGVMAFFNAPLPCPNHTLRAVQAALDIQEAIGRYNLEAHDHFPLSFDIGINVGYAVVGNVGTEQQMNYTAIGDTVNLAKRLEEHADGGQVLLSRAAYERVRRAVRVKDLGPLKMKGRAVPERAYALGGLVKDIWGNLADGLCP